MGYQAGYSNTTGTSRVMVGYEAGRNNTGSNNVFLGKATGKGTGTGAQTIAIGQGVMETASEASNSVFIGNYMAANCTAGAGSTVAIGTNCLAAAGYSAEGNTVVGHQAGNNLSSGDNNTLVGANAGDAITTGSNLIIIGQDAAATAVDATNEITLGNSSIATLRCQVTTITSLSDKRDKTNIQDSNYGLNIIDSLNPVTFEWNQRDGKRKGLKDLGFIAQDLQELDDDYLRLVYSNNPEKLEASYGRLIPVLVKAIQELREEVRNCKNCNN